GIAPYQLVFNRPPPMLSRSVFARYVQQADGTEGLIEIEGIAEWARLEAVKNLNAAEIARKTYYDKNRKGGDPKITAGMRVWRMSPAVRSGPYYKLKRPFMGPYRVM